MDETLMIALFMLFAAFVQGSIGFGFPLVTTILLSLFMDIQTAMFYTLLPSLYLNIVTIRSEGHFFEAVRKYYKYALLVMSGVGVGMVLLLHYETPAFKLLLALMIYLYLFTSRYNLNLSFVRTHPKLAMGLFGTLGGVVGGLTNAIGPIHLIYALESKFERAKLIQMGNVCFLGMKFVQLALFGFYGRLTEIELGFSAYVLLGVAFMFYLGVKIKNKMPMELYVKVIKTLLFVIATVLVVRTF